LTETRATNTGENFTLSRALLDGLGIHPHSATIISRPYQQRRAYATVRKLWPELEVVCSARALSLDDYVASIGDVNRVLNMLVGDTQRIWVYAKQGFAVPQPVDDRTLAAYERLINAGFTTRLLDESDQ
jgi:uncharacterized SAM-binding protein YcdF (DUF218 family)